MLPSQSSSVTADLLLSICEEVEDDPELSAVWGSSLPVSSQVSLKSEDLQEVHVVQEVQEMVRVISDEEVDNDRFLCGLPHRTSL